ncbi:late embryogenesis abundant protein Lea5 [Prunus yedoensis var. nudiflora]|uniref:Late embryogenesis abundant protein Lea5 n=1 Tax=Prunus yedoensis var. nudiflora TaxID=2094558 RepID=A0A314Z6P0_PRUYE|nr:late embryogenesis abundant protein Lea5 [Prunus yedoensis var. nudiflora]
MASLLYTKSKPLASFLPKTKFLIQRRCYAAASQGPVPAGLGREGSRSSMVEERIVNAMKEESGLGSSSAWAPDPRTGYYRPANCGDEIDPVELREMLLKHKTK